MRPSAGRKHDWFNPRNAGYMSLGDYESCRLCGVCKSARNEHLDNCRGQVHVTLRSER